MNIKVIENFNDMSNLNKKYHICFIDIDGTIFKNNLYYDLLADHHYTQELIHLLMALSSYYCLICFSKNFCKLINYLSNSLLKFHLHI